MTQLDSELEGPLPPAEALVEPTRESETDTESVRVVPRRRLVLQFARDEDGNNGSGDELQRSQPVEEELNEDLLFTPQTRAMSNGFEGLDEVSLGESESTSHEDHPQLHEGRVQVRFEDEFGGDSELSS